ncbi:hypothetical protein GCM10027280_48490 [Micromonospora polyrhachis]|uniref:Uncharacterized protein n=1 Tax=Micromonospora polyrhachis TaxID=1282883 RepID=A0A7W7SX76_9ACTN|nr:hypothetical protein [Micromonospora polyrhachis]MBB4962231.1 hypothetical protein [Micromonospora polyrhachis]
MTTSKAPDALLLGGPRDGTLFTAEDAAIVQLEIDGLIQRYLRTSRHEQHDGQPLVVFVYDGASGAGGAGSGLEPG